MSTWNELKQQMGFEPADGRRLHALFPLMQPHLPALVSDFMATLVAPIATVGAQDGVAQDRLRLVLERHVRDLFCGPYDHQFWLQRLEAGRRYTRLGISPRYLFIATNQLRRRLRAIVRQHLSPQEVWPAIDSMDTIIDLDLAVFVSSYMKVHEVQQLRTLQDLIVRNLPVTVLCLDGRGLVTAATRPSIRLFGETAELGRHYEDFLPADLVEAADLPSQVGQALATGEEQTIARVSLGEGPNTRHFRIHLVPLETDLARILLHIEELTEVVNAEAWVQQAEALARMGSLATNVAHEVRNPLTAIHTTLQVIGNSLPQDDQRRQILAKVEAQVRRLDRLVADLLHYATPPSPELSVHALAPIVMEAAARVGVPVQVQAEDDIVAKVDPSLLQQVLIHLLHNALDAAGSTHPVVVQIGPGPELVVMDEGPGITPAAQARLFTPFVTTKTRGTGLGLAISRKLTEAMGGRLRLDTTPPAPTAPHGARFRISLLAAVTPGHVSLDDTAMHSG